MGFQLHFNGEPPFKASSAKCLMDVLMRVLHISCGRILKKSFQELALIDTISVWLISSEYVDSEVECKVINRPVTCSWFIRSGSSASPCTTRSQPSSITTPLRRTPPPLNTRTFLLPGPSASPSLLGKMSACLRIHLGVDEAAVPPPQFWLLPKALSLLFQPCQQSEGWAT